MECSVRTWCASRRTHTLATLRVAVSGCVGTKSRRGVGSMLRDMLLVLCIAQLVSTLTVCPRICEYPYAETAVTI
jgi:hypothetical protein